MFRDIVFVMTLLTVAFFATLISTAPGFEWLHMQFVVGVSLYLYYRNNISIVFLLPFMFFLDVNREVQPAFSMLAFSSGAVVSTVIDRWLPLFKQYPFFMGRIVWLMLSIAIYLSLQGGEFVEILKLFLVAAVANTILIGTITFFLERFVLRRGDVDIELG